MQAHTDVLIVDATETEAELTVQSVQNAASGIAITRVKDGAQALEFLFSRGSFRDRVPSLPRLILLELELPIVHGLEVLAALRGHPEPNKPPVIVFTSTSATTAIEQSYLLGASGYIVKPSEREKYVAEVEALLDRWMPAVEVMTCRAPLSSLRRH